MEKQMENIKPFEEGPKLIAFRETVKKLHETYGRIADKFEELKGVLPDELPQKQVEFDNFKDQLLKGVQAEIDRARDEYNQSDEPQKRQEYYGE